MLGIERQAGCSWHIIRRDPPGAMAGMSRFAKKKGSRNATCVSVQGSGLVFKAHRLLYHSILGLREIKKKTKFRV